MYSCLEDLKLIEIKFWNISGEIGPYPMKEKCTSPIKPKIMESPQMESPKNWMVITKDVKELRKNPGYDNLYVSHINKMNYHQIF